MESICSLHSLDDWTVVSGAAYLTDGRCRIQFIGVNGGIAVCLAIYRILLTRLCGHFLSFRVQREVCEVCEWCIGNDFRFFTPLRYVQNDRMNVSCVHNDRMNVGCVHNDRTNVSCVHNDRTNVSYVHNDRMNVSYVQNDRMNVGYGQKDRMNVGCVQKDRVCRALRSE